MAITQSFEALRGDQKTRGGAEKSLQSLFEKSIEKVLSFEEMTEVRVKEFE